MMIVLYKHINKQFWSYTTRKRAKIWGDVIFFIFRCYVECNDSLCVLKSSGPSLLDAFIGNIYKRQ